MVPGTSSKNRQAFAVLIQEQLRQVGVRVNVDPVDVNAMVSRAGGHQFDALLGAWVAQPSPSGLRQTWSSAGNVPGGINYRALRENHQFDAEVDSAVTARDGASAKTPLPRSVPDCDRRRAVVHLALRANSVSGGRQPPHQDGTAAAGCVVVRPANLVDHAEWTAAARCGAGKRLNGCGRFVLSRIAQAAIVVALVGTLTFVLIHLAPGDPFGTSLDDPSVAPDVRQHMLAEFGYDRPLPEQYVRYVGLLARGELGYSHTFSRPVIDVLRARGAEHTSAHGDRGSRSGSGGRSARNVAGQVPATARPPSA